MVATEVRVDTTLAQKFVMGYLGKSDERMKKAVRMLTFGVERYSKQAITMLKAVDTGLLRSTIIPHFENSGLMGIVEPNTNYALAVHEGTGTNRKYGRRPYMEIGRDVAFGDQESVAKALESDIYGLI